MSARCVGRVGAVEVARVFERNLTASARRWFPAFDAEALRAHEHWLCPRHYEPSTGNFIMPVQSFVLRHAGQVILIDTCIGNHKDRDGSPQMHMLDEPYLERLAAVGITPEAVDFVMCTHLHVDHIGWNTRLVDGRWVPTFPNARYVMSRAEYAATRLEAEQPETSTFLKNCYNDSILPIVEAGRALFVDGLDELLDLVTFRPAPGHTPGNMQIELRSQGECAIFAGDILHSPMQIPFWAWSSMLCSDPVQSAASRRALLERCLTENALLIPGHFEAPHVGRIRDDHGSFAIDFGW